MNKKLCILLVCFYLKGTCQQNNGIQYPVSSAETEGMDLLRYKIHLVGEKHHDADNNAIWYSYLLFLNSKDIFPSVLFIEEGESVAFIKNLYLKNGDEAMLDLVENNSGRREVYKSLREYYLKLPENKRFRFAGTDSEDRMTPVHYSIRQILLRSDSVRIKKDQSDLKDLFTSFMDKPNPLLWSPKYVEEDVNEIARHLREDSMVLKAVLVPADYSELKRIVSGWTLANKRKHLLYGREDISYKREREMFMASAIYSCYMQDTLSFYYGQFGLNHVKFTNDVSEKETLPVSLANMLSSDTAFSMANNKVCSNTIYYHKNKKPYAFLGKELEEISSRYSVMDKNKIYLIKIRNSSVTNNLILFKR